MPTYANASPCNTIYDNLWHYPLALSVGNTPRRVPSTVRIPTTED